MIATVDVHWSNGGYEFGRQDFRDISLDALAWERSKRTWDAVTNRRIKTLHPKLQRLATYFINEVEIRHGIKLRVTQATRTIAQQNALYAQGRTKPGKRVTDARGGKSYHNYALAIDVVEIKNGKAIWDNNDNNWKLIGKVGISLGFTWGGTWKKDPDRPHFQMEFGLSIKQLRRGQRP